MQNPRAKIKAAARAEPNIIERTNEVFDPDDDVGLLFVLFCWSIVHMFGERTWDMR